MASKPRNPGRAQGRTGASEQRATELAETLRANLKRRKEAARRIEVATPQTPNAGDDGDKVED